MIIFPAIDIIDSKPVRLLKGDFSTAKQDAGDALETANGFEKIGINAVAAQSDVSKILIYRYKSIVVIFMI